MIKIGIYKITNKINNKVYIGQSQDIYARWQKHLSVFKNKDCHRYKLYRAMNKYGSDNFQFQIIQQCPVEKLDERECYWINFYNSFRNGYNMTTGGTGIIGTNDKIVLQYDCHGKFIKSFQSAHEAARQLNLQFTNICKVCRGQRLHAGGYIWRYENSDIPVKDLGNVLVRGLPILQYDLDMNLIHIYKNRTEAAKALKVTKTVIGNACNGKQKTAAGYIWKVGSKNELFQ